MGTPNYPKNFSSEWNQLRRDVKNAFTSANLRTGMAKIGAKVIEITGELAMNAGAILRAKYTSGGSALYVGPVTLGGQPAQGVLINRPDGSRAFDVTGAEDGQGFIGIWDRSSHVIFSDDAVSGQGVARPWIPYTPIETAKLTSPSVIVTTSTWTSVHTVQGIMQHPKMRLGGGFIAFGSDTGKIRLISGGSSFWESPVLGPGFVWYRETIAHPNYQFDDEFTYDIQVMRNSGAGAGVGFTPTYIMGRQS